MTARKRLILWILVPILTLIAVKGIWVGVALRRVGAFETEKEELLRGRLLKTAELAGTTVTRGGKSHYLLADIALVGEAITLAMRTATPWENSLSGQ